MSDSFMHVDLNLAADFKHLLLLDRSKKKRSDNRIRFQA